MEVKSSFLIVGCGTVGTKFAQYVLRQGHTATGTTRSKEKADTLQSLGIQPLLLDLDTAKGFGHIEQPDYILLSVAPTGQDSQGYQKVYELGIHRLMSYLHFHPPKKKMIYTSSIGVYDVQTGDWVDETFPIKPTTSRVNSLMVAEQSVLKGLSNALLYRLGGIYGRERNRLKAIQEKTFRENDLNKFANLIHVDDVVQSLFLLFDKGKEGEIYNGVDNEPTLRKELYTWLADQMGVSLKLTPDGVSSPANRSNQNKRCTNKKLLSLGYRFRYPNYQEGYKEILNESKDNFSDRR